MGCHVGHMSNAAFGYADDLLLLSPSIHGLEILVKTSESFASEYGVTFNVKKTEFWYKCMSTTASIEC